MQRHVFTHLLLNLITAFLKQLSHIFRGPLLRYALFIHLTKSALFFKILVENNQLLCGFLVKNNAMRADNYERKVNYDWPNLNFRILAHLKVKRKHCMCICSYFSRKCVAHWVFHHFTLNRRLILRGLTTMKILF